MGTPCGHATCPTRLDHTFEIVGSGALVTPDCADCRARLYAFLAGMVE
jgi:hypothetical protein